MKRFPIIQLAGIIVLGGIPEAVFAQINSVTRRTIQGGGLAVTYFGVATNRPAPATNLVWTYREKTEAEKTEMVRKTIEFQTKRADEGFATAQYDLGLRYLTGDGVRRNRDAALLWLRKAADQGHTQAAKKLEELRTAKSSP